MRLDTFDGGSSFKYEGNLSDGFTIYYGSTYEIKISGKQFMSLRKAFIGKTVRVETSRTESTKGTLGYWLKENILTRLLRLILPLFSSNGQSKMENILNLKAKRYSY